MTPLVASVHKPEATELSMHIRSSERVSYIRIILSALNF
jgi:hypothetical protein